MSHPTAVREPGRTVFQLPSTRTVSEIPSTPSVGRAATRQPPPTGQPADIVGATTPPCWPQPGTPTPWVNVPLRTRAGARSPACWFAAQPNDAEIEETKLGLGRPWSPPPRPRDCRLNFAPRRLDAHQSGMPMPPQAAARGGGPRLAITSELRSPRHETNPHTACIRNPKTGSAHEGYGE